LGWASRIPWACYYRTRGLINRLPGGGWLLAWTDPLHMARRFLHQAISQHAHLAKGRVLDLGCGGQPYRNLFQNARSYVGLDLPPNRQAEVHGNALALPFVDSAFDTILCSEVLEHVPEPARLIAECKRVLKSEGILLLTTPQTWGLHLEPLDYYRYTKYGLRYLAEKNDLEIIDIAPTCGLWATLSQRLSDTVIFNYAVGRSRGFVEFLSVMLAPVSLAGYGLDRLFGKRGDTLDHVMVARKPARE